MEQAGSRLLHGTQGQSHTGALAVPAAFACAWGQGSGCARARRSGGERGRGIRAGATLKPDKNESAVPADDWGGGGGVLENVSFCPAFWKIPSLAHVPRWKTTAGEATSAATHRAGGRLGEAGCDARQRGRAAGRCPDLVVPDPDPVYVGHLPPRVAFRVSLVPHS